MKNLIVTVEHSGLLPVIGGQGPISTPFKIDPATYKRLESEGIAMTVHGEEGDEPEALPDTPEVVEEKAADTTGEKAEKVPVLIKIGDEEKELTREMIGEIRDKTLLLSIAKLAGVDLGIDPDDAQALKKSKLPDMRSDLIEALKL